MRFMVGLGNPGREYEATRHNVGFQVIDRISEQLDLPLNKTKFNALYGQGIYKGEKVILLKPLTYMNLSGEAVGPFMDYFNIEIDELLVIYDDMDLPVGKMRLRKKGSAGGHNGMKSIIYHLESDSFKRMRIGIGRPPGQMQVIDYVLQRFSARDKPQIEEVIKAAEEACEAWISTPFDQVMNQFNR